MRRLIALVSVSGMSLLGLVGVRVRRPEGDSTRGLRTLLVLGVAAIVVMLPAFAGATVPGADGRIVYLRMIPGQTDTDLGDVITANPDGSQPRVLALPYSPENASQAAWSPDGSQLLISHVVRFDSSGNCCLPFRPAIMNADGSNFRVLPMTWAPPDADCSVWSLNQKRVFCTIGGDHPGGVFSVRASDGGDPIRLTTNPYGTGDQGDSDVPSDISPDGTRFVFYRFRLGNSPAGDPASQVALFVENMNGSGLHQVTPFGVASDRFIGASWSPDGHEILSATSEGLLFTVHPDGTQMRVIHLQVGAGSFAFEPRWSPSGSRIIFCLSANGVEGINTANPDGSDVTQVTTTPTFDDNPRWGTHPLIG
jgi:Tol biopolymer transport system component